MNDAISTERFKEDLLLLIEETFETVHGVYLDRGTSLLETLGGISADEASIPLGGKCATLAAQVAHVCFYLDVLERFLNTGENEQVDWGEIWRTVGAVTTEEWAGLQTRVRDTYQRTREMVKTYDRWDAENAVSGAIGMVAHCAYHLGEIRQATCILSK